MSHRDESNAPAPQHALRRRRFLGFTAVVGATVATSACGGGGGSEGQGTSPSPAPSPAPAPAPAPVPPPTPAAPPVPAPTGLRRISLATGTSSTQAPFCLGFAFREGDIPAGQGVVPSLAGVQVIPKSRWPDGSLRIAIVSGTANLTAGTVAALDLAPGSAALGAALGTADLKGTGVVASIECGGFGTCTWSGTEWDSPFRTWISGPFMSSWIYRKPVGSDAHLVAWLEVRLYAGGAVEVLPWIENGYLTVAGPSNRPATYRFVLGGTERFSAAIDLPHHCRTPLVSGAVVSHWLGANPSVVVRADATYFQRTELVPSYRGTVAATATAVTRLPSTYAPLQQGSYPAGMGQTGYHPGIGLLPEWDVLVLTCPNSNAPLEAVQRNAYSAGRYPLHYRDESTNRPLRFSQWGRISTNSSTIFQYPPTATGTSPQYWDIPHHPSVGYMAYLLTGRWYFLEQLQFAATYNYLQQPDDIRQRSSGIFLSNSGASTVRGAAWANRTLAQVAIATPDDDELRDEFLASLAANIDFNHGRFVSQSNNPFGIVTPYSDYGTPTDGKVIDAPWQQDFYTAAYGYMLAMKPNLTQATMDKLTAFFAWKARSIIGRLGGTASTDWLYRDAAQYNFVVALVDAPDWSGGTGPWAASWGALYQATLGSSNPGIAGDLRGGNFPEGTSYWGNLQPAISYALRHQVAGAQEAYDRMVGAANWAQLVVTFDQNPVWGIRPSNIL